MQLGFYARGRVSLPHPPYPKATLRLIERALAEAWRIIRDQPEGDFKIDTAHENRITRELRVCLMNAVLDGGIVLGFTSDLFRVTRDGKFESFDGTHLDQMPDLHIDIVRDNPASLPSADGLFVECKPVDRKHPAGGDYCDEGIIRFVNGMYAWALPEAFMIGYASLGYTLPTKLEEALAQRRSELKFTGNVAECQESSASGYTQHPHTTVHRRDFIYPSTNTTAKSITLRHLWFNRN